MNDDLVALFRYDLWANRRWAFVAPDLSEVARPTLEPAPPFDAPERIADRFVHILWAQRIWLARLGVTVEASGAEWPDALHAGWVGVLSTRDRSEPMDYHGFDGRTHARTLETVARHVANHGTYHRGELRALAEHRGLPFPETDYALWWSEVVGPSRSPVPGASRPQPPERTWTETVQGPGSGTPPPPVVGSS